MQNYFRTQSMGADKRTRTRGLLIDCAIDVFFAKGIEDASINEITASAGLANGTFYNHFKDKDELAYSVAEAITLELAKHLDQQMDDVERGLSRVVLASWAFLTLALQYEAWARVLLDQYQRSHREDFAAFKYMRADIERAVRQSEIEVTVDAFLLEQISALMVASLRMALNGGKHDGAQADMFARTCEHILRILGLTPAQALREVRRMADHPLLKLTLV